MFKVLLHDGCDRLPKVPLIQRGHHSLIHTVFLSKHNHVPGLVFRKTILGLEHFTKVQAQIRLHFCDILIFMHASNVIKVYFLRGCALAYLRSRYSKHANEHKRLEVLPELHHSWGLSHLLLLVRKLHRSCPTHLFLLPHLQKTDRDNVEQAAWD